MCLLIAGTANKQRVFRVSPHTRETEMRKTAPPLTKFAPASDAIFASALPRLLDSWLIHCDISRHSERTIETRRERLGRLVWFLHYKEYETCGLMELRAFFQY